MAVQGSFLLFIGECMRFLYPEFGIPHSIQSHRIGPAIIVLLMLASSISVLTAAPQTDNRSELLKMLGESDKTFEKWKSYQCEYKSATIQKMPKTGWVAVGVSCGRQYTDGTNIRRNEIAVKTMPDLSLVKEFMEFATYSKQESIRTKFVLPLSSKKLPKDLQLQETEVVDASRLRVVVKKVSSSELRARLDLFHELNAWLNVDAVSELLKTDSLEVTKTTSLIKEHQCTTYSFQAKRGLVHLQFCPKLGNGLLGYSIDVLEDLPKEYKSRTEFIRMFPTGDDWSEVSIERGTETTLLSGETRGRKTNFKISNIKELEEDSLQKQWINIPEGHRVIMHGRDQIKAIWENGKLKFVYNQEINESPSVGLEFKKNKESWSYFTVLTTIAGIVSFLLLAKFK